MEVSTDIPPEAKASEEMTAATLVPKEERGIKKEPTDVEKTKVVLKVEKEPSSKAVEAEVVAPVAVVKEEKMAELDPPEAMETTTTSSGSSLIPQSSAEASSTTHKPSSILDAKSEDTPFDVSQASLSPLASPADLPQDSLDLQLPDVESEPPFSPVDFSTAIPPAMFLPITPKIGMGKPAITKRKFSPGRPRVRQVRNVGKSSSFFLLQAMCLSVGRR